MNAAETSSGPSSATTSATEPAHDSPKLSESEFLNGQAADAKAAISGLLKDLKSSAGQSINPVQWTRDHPWISLGAGLIGGFVAASIAIPSKEQQALRRLERIEAALHEKTAKAERKEPDQGKLPGWARLILREVLSGLIPALASIFTPSKPPPDDGQTPNSPPPDGSGGT